jgi:pimeloyl-ACP methyl ester carboxylesterase
VLGRSLGAYVAVTLASARPLAGAILATPFDSIAAVAEERYPYLPMGMIVGGRYDAAAIAPTILTPALFVIADSDDVTPPEHGRALARAWGGPKSLFTLPDTGHRGVEWRADYWVQIARFLRSLEPARQAGTAWLPAPTARTRSPSD